MVAGACRHTRVGQPALGGDRCDDRLRAVTTCHREPVGTAGDGSADQGLEVVAGLELDGLYAPGRRLLGEREAFSLSATRARVEEEHRMPRSRDPRQVDVHVEGGTRRSEAGHESAHDQQVDEGGSLGQDQDQRPAEGQGGDAQSCHPGDAPPDHGVPRRGASDENEEEQDEAAGELPHRDDESQHARGRPQQQGEGREPSPPHGTRSPRRAMPLVRLRCGIFGP